MLFTANYVTYSGKGNNVIPIDLYTINSKNDTFHTVNGPITYKRQFCNKNAVYWFKNESRCVLMKTLIRLMPEFSVSNIMTRIREEDNYAENQGRR